MANPLKIEALGRTFRHSGHFNKNGFVNTLKYIHVIILKTNVRACEGKTINPDDLVSVRNRKKLTRESKRRSFLYVLK